MLRFIAMSNIFYFDKANFLVVLDFANSRLENLDEPIESCTEDQ